MVSHVYTGRSPPPSIRTSVTRRSRASGSRTRTRGPDVSLSAVGAVTITVPETDIANSASCVSPARNDDACTAFQA